MNGPAYRSGDAEKNGYKILKSVKRKRRTRKQPVILRALHAFTALLCDIYSLKNLPF